MSRASETNNLKVQFPDVAKEWHPTKNGALTPDRVTSGSGRRIWWLCKLGHEWCTDVYRRSFGGSQCPYCRGMIPSKDYNLELLNPELAAQWHPTKNGELTPAQVTPGSEKAIWWKCEQGHVWKTEVYNRKTRGCPECSRLKNKGKKGTLSLLKAFPDVAAEWHPKKNGKLTPKDVSYGSKKIVWWRCEEGHEWQQKVKVRAHGQACPYCSGIRPSKENNLKVAYPQLVKQWHPTKNGTLRPDQFTTGSEKFIWWICEKGHIWDAMIYERVRGSSCPYCMNRRRSKFISLGPVLTKQWHPFKNGQLTPDKLPRDSNKKVWWQCQKGHEWKAGIIDRKHGERCPICSPPRRKILLK
ncbi:MAG: hypothetical protein QG657_1506 [Acidobacteriota bacterium]|nr:hypothetical protein [Acidobacteriota bacterium]